MVEVHARASWHKARRNGSPIPSSSGSRRLVMPKAPRGRRPPRRPSPPPSTAARRGPAGRECRRWAAAAQPRRGSRPSRPATPRTATGPGTGAAAAPGRGPGTSARRRARLPASACSRSAPSRCPARRQPAGRPARPAPGSRRRAGARPRRHRAGPPAARRRTRGPFPASAGAVHARCGQAGPDCAAPAPRSGQAPGPPPARRPRRRPRGCSRRRRRPPAGRAPLDGDPAGRTTPAAPRPRWVCCRSGRSTAPAPRVSSERAAQAASSKRPRGPAVGCARPPTRSPAAGRPAGGRSPPRPPRCPR